MQLLNFDEGSPNPFPFPFPFSFSSSMFACEKVAFPFAVVGMFGGVLSGKLFQQCLTSWRLRWFLELLGNPNNA